LSRWENPKTASTNSGKCKAHKEPLICFISGVDYGNNTFIQKDKIADRCDQLECANLQKTETLLTA
jgi:hypothetical protein